MTFEAGYFVRAVGCVQRHVVFAMGEGRCEESDVGAAGMVQRADVHGQRGGSGDVGRVYAEQYFQL